MRKPVATEAEIQAAIVDFLRLAGCTVLRTCKRGQKNARGAYTTLGDRGVPDLIVLHEDWHIGMGLLMEVKRPGGDWSSAEQKALWQKGFTCRVTSVEEAAQAVATKFEAVDAEVPSIVRQMMGDGKLNHGKPVWGCF